MKLCKLEVEKPFGLLHHHLEKVFGSEGEVSLHAVDIAVSKTEGLRVSDAQDLEEPLARVFYPIARKLEAVFVVEVVMDSGSAVYNGVFDAKVLQNAVFSCRLGCLLNFFRVNDTVDGIALLWDHKAEHTSGGEVKVVNVVAFFINRNIFSLKARAQL